VIGAPRRAADAKGLRASLRILPALLLGALTVAATGGAANPRLATDAACPTPASGAAHCNALVRADPLGSPWIATDPTGLTPATVKSAYRFTTSAGAGAGLTVAIVDAYDHPAVEADLGVFNARFGLPACTTANGCFRKVDAAGGTDYPRRNAGWALEAAMDVEWAHGIAPGARILLVEAGSDTFQDLVAAEDYARTHAQYVSNSWGGKEFDGEGAYDAHFAQPGVSIFFSAGDGGLPAQYPSSSPNVISVGGTTLHVSGAAVTETGWSSGGGGCSRYEVATPAQAVFGQYGQVACAGRRATPDVSLVADPATGVSVYDSYKYQGLTGWFVVGGTSASTPLAAAHAATTGRVLDAGAVYGGRLAFRDVTDGSNGAPCLVGFDLCTGRGSLLG
jgi:subtilase family serine protease